MKSAFQFHVAVLSSMAFLTLAVYANQQTESRWTPKPLPEPREEFLPGGYADNERAQYQAAQPDLMTALVGKKEPNLMAAMEFAEGRP